MHPFISNKQVLKKVKVPSRAARRMVRVARARVVVRAGVPLDLTTQRAILDLNLTLDLPPDLDLPLDLETIALTLPRKNTTTRE